MRVLLVNVSGECKSGGRENVVATAETMIGKQGDYVEKRITH